MIHESVYELSKDVTSLKVADEKVEVVDLQALRDKDIDTLVRDAVFGSDEVKEYAQWLIWEAGQVLGARPASVNDFYMARGADKWADKTTPAMNIRFTTYDTSRAAFRAALKGNVGAFVFEIARSEMGYTGQPPAEYSTALIAAAIKEGYSGPIFIQGDHFQVKAATYASDPEGAIQEVKDLIAEAIPAGFWNIDIDTSTLVTLEPESLNEQQYHNYSRSAELTKFIRDLEPEGVTVSLGGEIGEVGEKNSTTEELDAYILGYQKELEKLGGNMAGLSKISVQTGTSHGGVVLPDGSIAKVAVDFDTLKDLGERAREHGSGGAVQHGASTLPAEMFDKFPEVETLEIHLATGFQNLFMDHEAFPKSLLDTIYRYLDVENASERKEGQTDAQFYYSTRKKAIAPFKPEMWALPADSQKALYQALEDQFTFYFNILNVNDTADLVAEITKPFEYHQPVPASARVMAEEMGLAD